jgi:hypothetical protein
MSDLAGYAKATSRISMTPSHVDGDWPSSLNGSISDCRSIVLKSSSAEEEAFVKAMNCGASVVIAAEATMTARMTVKL